VLRTSGAPQHKGEKGWKRAGTGRLRRKESQKNYQDRENGNDQGTTFGATREGGNDDYPKKEPIQQTDGKKEKTAKFTVRGEHCRLEKR